VFIFLAPTNALGYVQQLLLQTGEKIIMKNQFNFEASPFALINDRSANENSPQHIRRIHQALNRALGLQLPLDGVMGFRTRRAIRDFQRRKGLPADGIVNYATKQALMRPSSMNLRAMNKRSQARTLPARAARDSHDKFKKDCKGVSLLRRLTKDPSDFISKSARLKKKLEQVPELFNKIRQENDKLKEAQKLAKSEKEREALRKQHRLTTGKLLDQAGFDPRVPWTETSALAHARCELKEFKWQQYSLCSGKELEDPARFAKAVAEHYVRTEARLSLNGQTAKCAVHSIFCDARFANGIVVRVNFSNIPDYFTAVQLAPRIGPKREYRYSCFRGQINLSPNQDPQPYQRKFNPQAPSIPSGPFQVSRPTCQDLQSDLMEFQSISGALSRSVELLEKLVKQKRQHEPIFKETGERAQKQRATFTIVLEKMIKRTRSGAYLRGGCSLKDIAKVVCKIGTLKGVWLRTPAIKPIKELHKQLMSSLKSSRGAFKNVPCDRL
jgi:Putative peptidoglycan binding domain